MGVFLLLDENEIIELVNLSIGKIICNYMGVLDYCWIDYYSFVVLLEKYVVKDRYIIFCDGDIVILIINYWEFNSG